MRDVSYEGGEANCCGEESLKEKQQQKSSTAIQLKSVLQEKNRP